MPLRVVMYYVDFMDISQYYGRDIWKQEILKYSVNTNLLGMLSVEKLEK